MKKRQIKKSIKKYLAGKPLTPNERRIVPPKYFTMLIKQNINNYHLVLRGQSPRYSNLIGPAPCQINPLIEAGEKVSINTGEPRIEYKEFIEAFNNSISSSLGVPVVVLKARYGPSPLESIIPDIKKYERISKINA